MNSLLRLTILCLCLSLVSHSAFSDEDDEAKEHAGNSNSNGKTYSEKEGLKLSEAAQKRIGIKTLTIESSGSTFELPTKSLVYHQNEIGIYRLRDGWFKLIDVDVLSKGVGTVRVKCADLASDDKVVIQGVPLLRVAEIAAKSGIEGEGL